MKSQMHTCKIRIVSQQSRYIVKWLIPFYVLEK